MTEPSHLEVDWDAFKTVGDIVAYVKTIPTIAEGYRFMDAWRRFNPYADCHAANYYSRLYGNNWQHYPEPKRLGVRPHVNDDGSRNY